jgi:limonene-1,2-epoxide hydrolase
VYNHFTLRRSAFWLLLAGVALVGAACGRTSIPSPIDSDTPTDKEAQVQAGDYKLSGPYTHDNLTIYLIHGDDQLKDKTLLTLDEALEQKKIVVYETQQVNELAIENTSDEDVFMQSGDIIKGGQQDRVITSDLIVSAKSGKLPLDAFCVEQGRWRQSGGESVHTFASFNNALSSKDLKMANRRYRSQQRVWREVGNAQKKLSDNVGASVLDPKSESSLQLSLEDKKVQEAAQAYIKQLADAAGKDDDVIGYAFAINGKVNSADVYASHDLFKRLWPKLLKASAIEAVSELEKDKKFETPDADAVKAFLADAEKGKGSSHDVGKRFTLVQQETDKNLLFETRDKDQKDVMLRRNYLAK